MLCSSIRLNLKTSLCFLLENLSELSMMGELKQLSLFKNLDKKFTSYLKDNNEQQIITQKQVKLRNFNISMQSIDLYMVIPC
mgnify:CR=1 FL=1